MGHATTAGFLGLGKRKRSTDEDGAVRALRWYETWLAKAVISALAVAAALGLAAMSLTFAVNLTTRGSVYKTDIACLRSADSLTNRRIDNRDELLQQIAKDVSYMRGRWDSRDRGGRRDTNFVNR
jgi:hypothetical protein